MMPPKHPRDPNARPPLPPLRTPSPAIQESQQFQTRPSMEESPRSPLRSDSPRHSDEPEKPSSGSGAVVVVEKYYSPLQSPLPITPPKDASTPDNFSSNPNSHVINFDRAMREELASSAMVLGGGGNEGVEKRGGVFGGRRWTKKQTEGVVDQIVSRSRKKVLLVRAALGLRACELVLSLVSFSVMAADKTQGWSGDSFDRYKEYRFCLSVNVVAFVYSAFQAYALSSHLITGKHVISHHLRLQFDFIMDQILAYLLISASSAAASKIDDWQSNWGKDEFTEKDQLGRAGHHRRFHMWSCRPQPFAFPFPPPPCRPKLVLIIEALSHGSILPAPPNLFFLFTH